LGLTCAWNFRGIKLYFHWTTFGGGGGFFLQILGITHHLLAAKLQPILIKFSSTINKQFSIAINPYFHYFNSHFCNYFFSADPRDHQYILLFCPFFFSCKRTLNTRSGHITQCLRKFMRNSKKKKMKMNI
jgi:hypothetical protein